MAYRTVKEFPVVAETINKAVEQVVTGQRSARNAMDAAQEKAIADLYRPANSL
jgi:multiple sugar transport system substrate-binding protein